MTRFLEAVASVFVWIGVSILTVGLTGVIFAVYLAHPLVDPDRRFIHRIAGLWGRGLLALAPGLRVRVFGLENLPTDRPVILVANHQSYVDVPALFFIRRQFKWLADVALFRIPFFGWSMRMAGYVSVHRGSARQARWVMGEARRWLSRGISIFVFPEGTRSHTGAFGRFQTGGFRLAVLTRTPIVPVVLVGTRQLLPRGTWIFRIGVMPQIHILPPVIPPADLRQIHPLAREIRSRMEKVYQKHFREVR